MSIMSRSTFFFLVEIFKIKTFQSRLGCIKIFVKTVKIFVETVKIFVETVEINWDCQDFQDLSRLFKIYRDILTLLRLFEVLKDHKSWKIEKSRSRNVIKLTNSWSRLTQTVEICQKCHVSTDFSILIETFGTGRWCWDKIEISQSQSRYLVCQD
jgi:hypothetical protein